MCNVIIRMITLLLKKKILIATATMVTINSLPDHHCGFSISSIWFWRNLDNSSQMLYSYTLIAD